MRFSMEKWEFGKFMKGHWDTIKALLKVIAPYIVMTFITDNPALQGGGTIIGKCLLDVLHYYIKE